MNGSGRRRVRNEPLEQGANPTDPTSNLPEHMSLQDDLDALRSNAPARIAETGDLEALSVLEAETVGKQSPIGIGRASLRDLPDEERKQTGKAINEVATEVNALLAARRSELEAVEHAATLASDAVDVTLPGRAPNRGSVNIIQQVMDEVVDIFVAMGYAVATGPEAETEYYNFTALNFPQAHPTRLAMDTLYLEYGDEPVKTE